MSFILDALRKSEHERQRGAVPGISNVPFAVPQRETPRWMLALLAALAVAVIALGGAWWRSARVDSRAAESVASVPLESPATVPASSAPPPPVAPAVRAEPPPVSAPGAAPVEAARNSEAPPQTASSAAAQSPAPEPTAAAAPAAREPDAGLPTLPSSTALAAEGIAVPPLRLELHAYSERPAERFVFINGRKYTEGETLAEGPRVVSIERTGVVLSQQGRRFLLTP